MILTRDGKEIVAIYKQDGSEVDEVKDANGRLVYSNTREITGTLPLSFTSRGKPLSDYTIYGNTVQNGTPSPDTPVDVVGCGVRTENLLDGYLEIGGLNSETGEEYNPIEHWYVRTDYISVLKSETPTLCIKVTGVYIRNVILYNENKVMIAKIDDSKYFDNGYGCIIDLLDSCRYIRAYFQSDQQPRGTYERLLSAIDTSSAETLMLNLGSTALPYEPYGYKIPVTVDSDNLFDINDVTLNYRYDDNGNWVTDVGVLSSNIIAFPQNSDYIYSFKTVDGKNSGICRINFLDENGAWISVNKVNFKVAAGDTVLISGKTPPNTRYIRTSQYNGELNIKLIQSATALLYLSEPLRKIGDYADDVNSDGTVTRRIKKLVLTGEEDWRLWKSGQTDVERYYYKWGKTTPSDYGLICTHFRFNRSDGNFEHIRLDGNNLDDFIIFISKTIAPTVADFKSYLADQYATGTPVTVWYVLAEPDTSIVNEPLMKIGDYADTISFTQAEVVIPTVSGSNVLDTTSPVKPSEVYIKGKGIKAIT